MAVLKIWRQLIIAAIVVGIGVSSWWIHGLSAQGSEASRSAHPSAAKAPLGHSGDWLIPTQVYLQRYPPMRASQAMADSTDSSPKPAVVQDGALSRQMVGFLTPMLTGSIGQVLSMEDQQTTPTPIGSVTWQAMDKNDGTIVATMQRLTEPLPIGIIGGNDNVPVARLANGSEYIIVYHPPFFRQLIVVLPNSMFYQITAVAGKPAHSSKLGKLGLSQAQLLRIATSMDATTK